MKRIVGNVVVKEGAASDLVTIDSATACALNWSITSDSSATLNAGQSCKFPGPYVNDRGQIYTEFHIDTFGTIGFPLRSPDMHKAVFEAGTLSILPGGEISESTSGKSAWASGGVDAASITTSATFIQIAN